MMKMFFRDSWPGLVWSTRYQGVYSLGSTVSSGGSSSSSGGSSSGRRETDRLWDQEIELLLLLLILILQLKTTQALILSQNLIAVCSNL